MKKIKIIGALIFIFSILLAFIFNHTAKENIIHNKLLETIKEQKSFTQEISKNIFYIYKNNNEDVKTLDDLIKTYLNDMNNREKEIYRSDKIIKFWNLFYLHVQHFRDQIKVKSPYMNILLEKEVNDIYTTNSKLIQEFNKLIKIEELNFNKTQNIFMIIQYILFAGLVILLLYLFFFFISLVAFVQEFLFKSKKIITSSSIKELEPININYKNQDILDAENNFNTLVSKINNNVENSSKSIEHSYKSLEILELHVEELVNFIYDMHNDKADKELRKKEDSIIQSLEELSSTKIKLRNLKVDLDNLISHSKKN